MTDFNGVCVCWGGFQLCHKVWHVKRGLHSLNKLKEFTISNSTSALPMVIPSIIRDGNVAWAKLQRSQYKHYLHKLN